MLAVDIPLAARLITALEAHEVPMAAYDYQSLALDIGEALRGFEVEQLIRLARSSGPTLATLAENVLFDVAGCLAVGETDALRRAESQATALIERLMLPLA